MLAINGYFGPIAVKEEKRGRLASEVNLVGGVGRQDFAWVTELGKNC